MGNEVLVIGYGNPGRLDDGLGPALAKALEEKSIAGVTIDSDYQLTVEDAAMLAEHQVVIFVDADTTSNEPFYFKELEPVRAVSFSSHSVRPEALVALAQDLFDAKTKAYVLGIRGYEFNEFGERLSTQAQENLQRAVEFLEGRIVQKRFDGYPDSNHKKLN